MNLLTITFLGLTALIVVCQLIPATIMFVGLVKGMLTTTNAVKS